jgi:hypothetical protein
MNHCYDGDEHSRFVTKRFPHQVSKFLKLKQNPGSHENAVRFDQSISKKVTTALTCLIVTHEYAFTKVVSVPLRQRANLYHSRLGTFQVIQFCSR